MCDQKTPANSARKTTDDGIVWYENTPAGHQAMAEDEAKTMGPGSEESQPDPPGEAPPEAPSDECKDYNDSMWNTLCSKHFKYSQMRMKPDETAFACNWQHLCQEILDKIIDGGFKFTINSAYRSAAYNAKIGGSKTSDHMTAKAADISMGSVEKNKELFKWIGKSGLPFSQMIFEGKWIHISFNGKSPPSVAVLVTRTGKSPYENGGGRNGKNLPPDLRWA